MPALYSFSATCSAAYCVATNTSTRDQLCSLTRWRSSWVRRLASTAMARCSMAGSLPGVWGTSTRTGCFSRPSASACTAAGNVAEKNRFCRRAGNSASTRCSSSAKPRSSSRSASSSTRCATADRRNALWSTRSSRRPGVATTMSAPPRKPSICGLMDTPPNTMAILSGCCRCCARLRSTSPTCAASSRVGTSTRARTRRGPPVALSCSCCSKGSAKAAVLPDPVCAAPSRSTPCRMAGMAPA